MFDQCLTIPYKPNVGEQGLEIVYELLIHLDKITRLSSKEVTTKSKKKDRCSTYF